MHFPRNVIFKQKKICSEGWRQGLSTGMIQVFRRTNLREERKKYDAEIEHFSSVSTWFVYKPWPVFHSFTVKFIGMVDKNHLSQTAIVNKLIMLIRSKLCLCGIIIYMFSVKLQIEFKFHEGDLSQILWFEMFGQKPEFGVYCGWIGFSYATALSSLQAEDGSSFGQINDWTEQIQNPRSRTVASKWNMSKLHRIFYSMRI